MEPDVFGRYAILNNMITDFFHKALHAVSIIYQPSQRVSDEYDLLKAYGNI